MTDFMEYKRRKASDEKEQLNKIEKEIEDIDYQAALRAAGIIRPDEASGIPAPIQARYDSEQLKRLNELNKKLTVTDLPDELADMKLSEEDWF